MSYTILCEWMSNVCTRDGLVEEWRRNCMSLFRYHETHGWDMLENSNFELLITRAWYAPVRGLRGAYVSNTFIVETGQVLDPQ
jgi:hypothetical protein